MNGLWLGIAVSLVVFIGGTTLLCLLLKRYKGKLLYNFSKKIAMTFWLALIFGALFLIGNVFLAYYVVKFKANFAWYLEHPFILAREGLIFFIMNSCLILACRALIKDLYNLRN